MRGLILLIVFAPAAVTSNPDNVARLTWITGCWAAAEGEIGSGEMWTTTTGGVLLGINKTVKAGKTRSYEFMQIRELEPGRIAFIAKPSGQAETTFIAIEVTDTGVVFENKAHDFPQRVIYRSIKGGLLGRIEGTMDGVFKAIDYPMMRRECPL